MVIVLGTFFVPYLSFIVPSNSQSALIFKKSTKNDLLKSSLMLLCLICCVISFAGVYNIYESSSKLTSYLDKDMTKAAGEIS